jgi:hypothetical protein
MGVGRSGVGRSGVGRSGVGTAAFTSYPRKLKRSKKDQRPHHDPRHCTLSDLL